MVFSHLRVIGHSMMPTISPNDHLFATNIPYLFSKPKKGDIVVFRNPKSQKLLVKRILSIFGNEYKVGGDNVTDSLDSRDFGVIDRQNILAKVVYILRGN